jgi:hypothetical protein
VTGSVVVAVADPGASGGRVIAGQVSPAGVELHAEPKSLRLGYDGGP